MFVEDTDRKNTIKKMCRSKSEVIKVDILKADFKNAGNHKFRRRSLMMKSVKIEDQKFPERQDRTPQTMTELRFLADIIKKKQEPAVEIVPKIE